ncbi:MAG: hypothetical protein K2Q20_00500 [Phycisphaerales bacterium]|nr:hypothetical protein [Phycisphaerales bacterium]
MASDYAAFASDFYINMRMNLKMDLAMRRDTVLSMFDRIRREFPGMERFKRYTDELALESRPDAEGASAHQQWIAVRKTSLRSGSVNPESNQAGYALHKLLVQSAPYYLDISALDIEHVELLWGFDLPAAGNHDSIVCSALLADSPLAGLLGAAGRAGTHAKAVDCQPTLGVALSDDGRRHAVIEAKTRNHSVALPDGREQPISLYLIIRQHGPFKDVKDLLQELASIATQGEELLDAWVIPKLLNPLREAISSGH